MNFWRKSDGEFNWLSVVVLLYMLSAATKLFVYGPKDVRWIEPLCLAVAFGAILPFHEPPLKSWPWHRQLRTPRGLLSLFALVVLFLVDWYRPH